VRYTPYLPNLKIKGIKPMSIKPVSGFDEIKDKRDKIKKAENETDEAMKDMVKALKKISTANEFNAINQNEDGMLGNIKKLAQAFTIVADRIQELDPDLQKKLQAKQQPAQKNKPKTP